MFFYLSKIFWFLVSPGNLLILLTLFALALWWWGKKTIAICLMGTVGFVCLFVAVFPVGLWLLEPLENRFLKPERLPEKIDGILLLGGSERRYQPANPQKNLAAVIPERHLAFAQLINQYPDAKKAYSGGSGELFPGEVTATDIAEEIMGLLDIATDTVTVERKSRNTFENAVESYQLLAPAPDENWLLITEARHMPRAMGVFYHVGWPVIPYPVNRLSDTDGDWQAGWSMMRNLKRIRFAIREWLGLFFYYYLGKTDVLFPQKNIVERHE